MPKKIFVKSTTVLTNVGMPFGYDSISGKKTISLHNVLQTATWLNAYSPAEILPVVVPTILWPSPQGSIQQRKTADGIALTHAFSTSKRKD